MSVYHGQITKAGVYRFNDLVVINVRTADNTAKTLYLTVELAELVAGLVGDAAEDIRERKFTSSDLPEYTAELVCNEARLRKGL